SEFEDASPYSREDIEFSGYDKKLTSSSESFFVTNRSNRTITAIELTIDYLTLDGRQLNKKFHKIQCAIPPGETRMVDVKSWDTQHSFYYEKSAPARAAGTPFTVKFYPSAFYLKY
ncbi:MAG: hypothetical protein K2G23_06770, partial [Muribaculaceae bacterium]|nr:hypothetical protein [Muribaculaceae bacterium]